ncbi:peptide antibiotic transporter SbmA [Rhizobiaceae bacterium CRRU44]|uniref:Peptide antibiotic transporter SbmA n=1 Tax=Ferranicluibacter rubi TaxID=2715133 RepID=A0AA43ZH74_9HYPH|nr:peptide antibiotic transporter SbmA [Ferranicluibacter rubi]NHT76351.1 peptide antibiotic transporter SbmA [Ferranicluibacter rubi]
MFHSFFPKPKLFFTSMLVWTLICILLWFGFFADWSASIGFAPVPQDQLPIDLRFFLTPDNRFFYAYFFVCTVLFGGVWNYIARDHPWIDWSIWGSALITFCTYFGVQVSVAINNWRRPFGDLLQDALTGKPGVTVWDFYSLLLIFCQIVFLSLFVSILTDFFVSHYVFRWRTAMNNYYMSQWARVRHIEGASQRVQEDTMRFANILEGLGVSLINAVMTLIVFLPILLALSSYVTELPFIGPVSNALFWLAIGWSVFGTVLFAIAGIKLPGLHFRNQRVEAAYRKELVYGEDHADRAQPATVTELFANVRRNYYRMYWHYLYFNVARYSYSLADVNFVTFMLVPTLVAHKITFGVFQQISTAFGQVSNSFQYLVNSWTTIIELLSIHKRLKAFEAAIDDLPLPEIDQRYLRGENEEEVNPAQP